MLRILGLALLITGAMAALWPHVLSVRSPGAWYVTGLGLGMPGLALILI